MSVGACLFNQNNQHSSRGERSHTATNLCVGVGVSRECGHQYKMFFVVDDVDI
jgi:hypothetical protein